MEELEPKIRLWSQEKPALDPSLTFTPYLVPYLIEDGKAHDAIVILPGGGYACKCTDHEGIQIVQKFRSLGYHTFIVDYRCGMNAYPYPAPQEDALRAVKIVRGNAEKWHINRNRIAAVGFSAGGHLCASLGVWSNMIPANNGDEFDKVSGRPDAVILSYAVISAHYPHQGTFCNLLNSASPSLEEMLAKSCEKYVKPGCPPAFIWATATDEAVPVENSYRYAQACQENNVPYALHIYPAGPHGLGIGVSDEFKDVRSWPSLCQDFLNAVWNK